MDRPVRRSGDGREADVLARLSMQSQKIQADVYCSLQHMKLQRAQLQTSLRQQIQTSDNNTGQNQNGVSPTGFARESIT